MVFIFFMKLNYAVDPYFNHKIGYSALGCFENSYSSY